MGTRKLPLFGRGMLIAVVAAFNIILLGLPLQAQADLSTGLVASSQIILG